MIVAEDLGSTDMEEVLRVLAPRGVACVKTADGWAKTVKPRQQGMDEWTHYLYDATGNAVSKDTAVGPPRHFQWIGGPRWVRHHDHVSGFNAAVSAGGRLYVCTMDGAVYCLGDRQ
jgi:hypothetical protein